jgi:hypothetical protein
MTVHWLIIRLFRAASLRPIFPPLWAWAGRRRGSLLFGLSGLLVARRARLFAGVNGLGARGGG